MLQVWIQTHDSCGGPAKFFYMSVSHDTLTNHLKTNFALTHQHHYSLSDIENMVPWERQAYIALINAHLKEEEEKQKQQLQKRARM
jgi:hypothetical protein